MKKLIIYTLALLFSSCSNLFYFPTDYFYADPKTQDIEYSDIDFKSTDDTQLHGWLMTSNKVKKKKGLILYFHGNAQNLTSHWLNLGWLTKKGYDIFIFDYRGYGLSKGQANQQGLNKDSIAALNWAYEKQRDYPKFIVYGQSLGGAVSMRALKDFKHRDEIDLYILDSTFISYQSIAFDKLKNAGVFVVLSPLSYILVSDEYAARDFVSKIEIPTLVIHGQKDPIVPYKFGQEIYQKLSTKKKWWWSVEDGGHTDIFWPKNLKYRSKFVTFLDELD
ncbi:alpha/beta hydrolase [Halobacteriovorax sp. HLS]|uniref:alpha/beta hydrolase n=1 Tax=Halobacteriovorax sp. HLS TaxID=2234000 RepID=UPI000FD7DC11|nr:alpha/beta hydrolase [Halobacteriovorax sp. HLS]